MKSHPPQEKVDKEVVRALKADQYSYLRRTSARQTQRTVDSKLLTSKKEQEPLSTVVTINAINALSDSHKHQEEFNLVAERHPSAQRRAKEFAISESFFLEGGAASGEGVVNGEVHEGNISSGGGRQEDYQRGELMSNPFVRQVMEKCAEEGTKLLPRHHAADWSPVKERVRQKQREQRERMEETGENGVKGSEVDVNDHEETSAHDVRQSRSPHVSISHPSSNPAKPLSPTSSRGDDDDDEKPPKVLKSEDLNTKQQSHQQSQQRSPVAVAGRRGVSRGEKLQRDMKKLKEKRISVNLFNEKSGLHSAALTKSGVRLKQHYQHRFQHIASLIKHHEECANTTKRLRARGVLRDELLEDQAIAKELDSQRELTMTRKRYGADPLWKRPVNATASPPHSGRVNHDSSGIESESGTGCDGDSYQAGGEASTNNSPMKTSPRRHQNQIKWHRNPTQDDGKQPTTMISSPIKHVTLASLAAEMDSDDSSDSEDEESEVPSTLTNTATDVSSKAARRPTSAPSTTSFRSHKIKKQIKQSAETSRRNIAEDDSCDESSEGGGEDDHDDGEEESSISLRNSYRHKRPALMGPRAQVASDNDQVSIHKTQLATEIDAFVELYGRDALTSGKRQEQGQGTAFSVVSTYLLANAKLLGSRRNYERTGSRDAKMDTLGIMDIFLRDMKQRHEKVQQYNVENPNSITSHSTASTKEALLASYNMYWRKQRGISSDTETEKETGPGDGVIVNGDKDGERGKDKISGDGGGDGGAGAGAGAGDHGEINLSEKEMREQFQDERRMLLENRKQASRAKKEQNKRETHLWLVNKMNELMSHLSPEASDAQETHHLSVEVSLLFRGFEKLDKTQDGFLCPADVVRVCRLSGVQLKKKEISAMLWLMDDHRRGKLTFDDVMKFYIRNRGDFLKSGEIWNDGGSSENNRTDDQDEMSGDGNSGKKEGSNEVIQAGFGVFGVECEGARGRLLDGEEDLLTGKKNEKKQNTSAHVATRPKTSSSVGGRSYRRQKQRQSIRQDNRHYWISMRRQQEKTLGQKQKQEREQDLVQNDEGGVTMASGDLRSQPLLLFRLLFFVALQSPLPTRASGGGDIHLLSAFQTLSELFGNRGENRFHCIFLRSSAYLQDGDRETLGSFVCNVNLYSRKREGERGKS